MSISNDLRQAVLQAAIQGKITKQLPEDGNAKDLLEQIKAEKAKHIKEGKLKKEKPLPEITDDEKPFDIPENWEWCRLGSIGFTNIGLTYKPANIKEDGIVVLRSSNIQNGRMCYEDIVKVDLEIPESKMCKIGDILICARNGSKRLVGKAALIDGEGMSFGAFMAIYRSMCNPYVLNVINSEYFRSALLGDVGTTTINQITQDMLKSAVVPLPPLSEQKRIVAKVEELMAKIDELEKTEQELEALKKAFPADMKASLLQAAMQGKLTEQLPEDGNAKDLLEQIKAEKAKLIKEGKLKKEKPLHEITDDEKPFDIPGNWEWVRLEDIVYECFQGINTAADKVVFVNKDGVPIIQTGDITSGVMNISNTKLMSLADYEKYECKYQPRYNDIFYCNIGTIGKPYIYRQSYKMLFHWNLFIIKYNYKMILPEFLKSVLEWHTRSFKQNTDGTAMQFVSKKKLINAVISIPPLAEQKRIVEKLEKLLPLYDGLE